MPGGIKYFGKDPNGLGRGSGAYYLRGKGYYSKYDVGRDKKKRSKGYNIDPVGFKLLSSGKHIKSHIPQITDGKIWR